MKQINEKTNKTADLALPRMNTKRFGENTMDRRQLKKAAKGDL